MRIKTVSTSFEGKIDHLSDALTGIVTKLRSPQSTRSRTDFPSLRSTSRRTLNPSPYVALLITEELHAHQRHGTVGPC